MRVIMFVFMTAVLITAATAVAEIDPQQQVSAQASMKSMPLTFTQNMGQWPDSILFRTDAGGATVWITRTSVYYQLFRRIEKEADKTLDDPMRLPGKLDHERDSIETIRVKAAFVGSNPNPEVIADGLLDYKCNYFLGDDPSRWATDVPNCTAVTLRGIYDGIDVRFAGGRRGSLSYQYKVSAGADVTVARIEYAGFTDVMEGEHGIAAGETEYGRIDGILAAPRGGTEVALNCQEAESSEGKGSDFVADRSGVRSAQEVTLVFGTYMGGSDHEESLGLAVDGHGRAYVTGETWSSDFPAINANDYSYNGERDVFVTKLSSDGTNLIYSTYIGGSSQEYGWSLAVDGAGCAYVTGETSSSNLPTVSAYDDSFNGGAWDVFVSKLSDSGNSLVYSTFLGGSDYEYGYGLAVDAAGCAYVTGPTSSGDFPTMNAYDNSLDGLTDVFVSKLSSDGNSLVYSTYLGGTGGDYGYGLAVDGAGCAYVSGGTSSSSFPTMSAFDDSYNGSWDIFVSKLSGSGNNLIYSTYVGGSDGDYGRGLAVDGAGSAYVTGYTLSSNFPNGSAYDGSYNGSWDAFVSKLASDGTNLVYSTYLGGSSEEYGWSLAVDGVGSAYVTGYTLSSNFPTMNAFENSYSGAIDVFVSKLSSSGNSLVYSTYLGGSDGDYGYDLAVDGAGSAYVTGHTASSNFPTMNAYDDGYNGSWDVFVTKLSVPSCCTLRGDFDDSGSLNVADLTALIAYLFRGGPAAACPDHTDVNGDGSTAVSDLTVLIAYLFRSGPAPAACS